MIKTGSWQIRKAEAGLKKAKQGIGKTQKTFQGSLTSDVIGSEDEEDRADLRQRRVPNSIRRRKPVRGENTVSSNAMQLKSAAKDAQRQTFIKDDGARQVMYDSRSARWNATDVRQTLGRQAPTRQTSTRQTSLGQTSVGQAAAGRVSRRVAKESATRAGEKVFSAAATSKKAVTSKKAATTKTGAATAAKGTKVAAGAATGAATAGTGAAAMAAASAAKMAKEKAKQVAVRAKVAIETSMQSKGSKKHTPFSQEEGGDRKKRNGAGGIGLALLAAMGSLLLFVFMMILMLMIAGDIQNKKNEQMQAQASSRNQIVAVAKAELEASDSNVGGTKYKTWYGMDANWCAMFVSWCSNECGYIEDGIMPKTASVANMRAWYEERDEFHEVSSDYEPQPGDVIIFGNGTSHTGLVIAYDTRTGSVTTIEGNTGSSSTDPYHKGSHVKQKSYPKSYAKIAGYCSPSYPVEEATETELTETET